MWSRWHCANSGEAKWIQNTIIGNLYSEYHQKLYWQYWTFLQDYQYKLKIVCILNHWEHWIPNKCSKVAISQYGQYSSFLMSIMISMHLRWLLETYNLNIITVQCALGILDSFHVWHQYPTKLGKHPIVLKIWEVLKKVLSVVIYYKKAFWPPLCQNFILILK